jgi:hypothetical protein
MKTPFALLALILLACALPASASAQCDGACGRYIKSNGEIGGFACFIVENSGSNCIATTRGCSLAPCSNAFLTTTHGRLVAVREDCPESPSLPARVASALGLASSRISALLEQRGRTAMAASRPAGAGPS